MPKVKKGQRKRPYQPKTRTGCLTCKSRSTGRVCDGYDALNDAMQPTLTMGPSEHPDIMPRAQQSFANFVHHTWPQLAGFFKSDFWDRIVLQAAHHEPTVRHAVVALGSCYGNATAQFARGHYNLAIKQLVDPNLNGIERSIDTYLISAVLFACFESMQGNHRMAISHIQNGVKLLSENVYDKDTGMLDCRKLGDMRRSNSFTSLEAYARTLALSDSQASKIIADYQRPFIEANAFYSNILFGDTTASFSSIEEAKSTFEYGACLFSGGLDAKISDDDVRLPRAPAEEQLSHMPKLMAKFWTAVHEVVLNKTRFTSPKEELAAAALQISVLVTWISFEVDIQGGTSNPIQWDQFKWQLQKILTLGERIIYLIPQTGRSSTDTASFCLESCYIIPIYAVASNCRDVTTRRRAIAILRSAWRQEGLWNSFHAASAAERIIQIEEIEMRKVQERNGKCLGLDPLSIRPLLQLDANGGKLRYCTLGEQGIHTEVVEELFSW
ncbi:hypothetical protein F5Y16DRAFT_37529 [Xylariaceae sp. FL0255]|nr:hypothetical protein F5Y16DRAFT_37529 [Xylariaceae sp. FL0255]